MTENCGWCGRPIETDFFWTENTRGIKIHSSCMEFLWKLGYNAKEYSALFTEIQNHFDAIRAYHASKDVKKEEKR